MIKIAPLQQLHLPQLQTLINAQLSALAPGWSLPEAYIASNMVADCTLQIANWGIRRPVAVQSEWVCTTGA